MRLREAREGRYSERGVNQEWATVMSTNLQKKKVKRETKLVRASLETHRKLKLRAILHNSTISVLLDRIVKEYAEANPIDSDLTSMYN